MPVSQEVHYMAVIRDVHIVIDEGLPQHNSENWIHRKHKGYLITKRSIDVALSVVALVLFFPIICLIALILKITDPSGPILHRQVRVGRYAENFVIYKFRTMVPNAERLLMQDPVLYAKYVSNNYKLSPDEDPRITPFGRFLRKTSLDELPQLFNVLKGDMSIVGPRPIVKEELAEYKDKVNDFLSVKPGLTGYWTTNGRSDVGYPLRASLELYYVYNQSLIMDLKIIFRTILIVLKGKGAY
jgi:exopolysaccharide production protein ExoY